MSRRRGRGGRRRGQEAEEHVNHERWLVSYADMVTVLMALFIVMFAISQVDQQKFIELRDSLAVGFGAQSVVNTDGGKDLLDHPSIVPAQVVLGSDVRPDGTGPANKGDDKATDGDGPSAEERAAAEVERFVALRDKMHGDLAQLGLEDRVRFRLTERGLIIGLVAQDVFFTAGSDILGETARTVTDTLGKTLRELPEEIAIEGHTNDLNTALGSRFPTNWELSTARATAVLRRLVEVSGVAPENIRAVGFGESRPLFPLDDERALVGNRRVDMVIVADLPDDVRKLLPNYAAEVEQYVDND